ncbi:MAG: hypothetical protein FD147_2089 [Chloroflexi bacterium]|nr:MAG: hypothetical protein FD147_2089 [Chloroflexota bacterium]
MNCARCGFAVTEPNKYCPNCGAARPISLQDFVNLEKRTADLLLQYSNRTVTEETYRQNLQDCILADPFGGSWMIDQNTREWQWFDGKKWRKRNPYIPQTEATVTAALKPAGRPRIWLWALIGVGLALILVETAIVGWSGGWLHFGPRQSFAVAALAYRLDDTPPALSLYVGSPMKIRSNCQMVCTILKQLTRGVIASTLV